MGLHMHEIDKKLSGGQLIVYSLYNLGVKNCFGVPGESYLAVLDALYDNKINFTICRHEGSACFAATAWGKLTGIPGICFVTRGPGATNASIGVHTAMQDSSPMILFVGQVRTDQMGREAFQEINYRSFFSPIAKWATEIEDVDRIPEIINRAWKTAVSGRPGPVVIGLPENILTEFSNAKISSPIFVNEPSPNISSLEKIEDILSAAKTPLVMAGGGGWTQEGKNNLKSFVERENLPFIALFRCQDIFDNHSNNYIGDAGVGMAEYIEETIKTSDVILAINSRFGEISTKGWSLFNINHPTQKIIHTHSSDFELGKIVNPELAIHSGPNEISRCLYQKFKIKKDNSNFKNRLRELRDKFISFSKPPAQNSPVDMSFVMSWLQENLDDDVVISNGAGNFSLWPNKCFLFGKNQKLLAPQSGAMGYGLPAAIAAAVENKLRQVICFAGDGDIQMGLSELGTAVQAGLKIIVIVLNNNSYGTIRMHQEKFYPGRVSGTSLENPDFAKIANSWGMYGKKVEKTEQFPEVFKEAQKSSKGALIDLKINVDAISPYKNLSSI